MRIISLLPAATEIVHALGMGDQIVGRSHECDYPATMESVPVCSRPKYPLDGSSYSIHRKVEAIIAEGLSVFRVDADRIRELQPDIIITQEQCEVCAVSLDELQNCLKDFGTQAEIVNYSPETLPEIYEGITTIAESLGLEGEGKACIRGMKSSFHELKESCEQAPRRHVEIVEWIEPLMAAGNWIPELLDLAGGHCSLAKAGTHSPFIPFQKIQTANPDVLIIIPCGYSMDKTLSEMDTLTSQEGWRELEAVRNNEVYIADGHHYFNRPGPRMVDSTRILAEILHPDRFEADMKGVGWMHVQAN